jgi:hypothetical protein
MPNAEGPMQRTLVQHFLKTAQLPGRAPQLQPITIAAHGDPCGIVSAVLEPAQSLNNDRDDFRAIPDVSDNAAHISYPTPELQLTSRRRKL